MAFGRILLADMQSAELHSRCERLDRVTKERLDSVMKKDNGKSDGSFGIFIGGIVAVAAAIFIFSGGELGGKKTVEGDRDLPPLATTER
jgi:hypothetical protein